MAWTIRFLEEITEWERVIERSDVEQSALLFDWLSEVVYWNDTPEWSFERRHDYKKYVGIAPNWEYKRVDRSSHFEVR